MLKLFAPTVPVKSLAHGQILMNSIVLGMTVQKQILTLLTYLLTKSMFVVVLEAMVAMEVKEVSLEALSL